MPLTSPSFEELNVADVRRALSSMRSTWEQHTPCKPIDTTNVVINDLTMAAFAFHFVYSHHEKRHCKAHGDITQ